MPSIGEIQAVRAKYAHLEDHALRSFNRRLTRRHALSRGSWSAYLDKVISEEVLKSEQKAEEFEAWITGLHKEYTI